MRETVKFICALYLGATATAATAQPPRQPDAPPGESPRTAWVDGLVHTQDPDLPRAEALVTEGDRIVFVGATDEALRRAGDNGRRVDLQGRFVMPGVVDSHTHPGLIAVLGDVSVLDDSGELLERASEGAGETDRMPSRPKEATLAWLKRYADENPSLPIITQSWWDVAAYLPHGPRKEDLDRISSTKPIVLYDNSGHSTWVNSATLRMLGIDRNTPDVSENLSHFARDENGEPTGWVKEWALHPYLGALGAPAPALLKERLLKYLNHVSSKGVTTLWDAGNFNMDDAVYRAASELAREGRLPLHFEGSYHIWRPEQIDTAAESLLRLRREYGHGRLRFNSIKIHYDGMQEILTAGMLEPYVNDPDNTGAVLFTAERLADFIRELDGHGIDLHLHASGDRAARNVLDAVEAARRALGRPLEIEVTTSHLFTVAESDIERFSELDVHANFTPHWFGGTVFGTAREINAGPERASRSQVVGRFLRQGANVTLSSDVVVGFGRMSPFIGIEMSVTRRAMNRADAPVLAPEDAAISVADALAAYTVNGARQLGLEGEIGALKAGLRADFLVLPNDLFATDVSEIHRIEPAATIMAGELRSGSL